MLKNIKITLLKKQRINKNIYQKVEKAKNTSRRQQKVTSVNSCHKDVAMQHLHKNCDREKS